jgi:hypothetical protein
MMAGVPPAMSWLGVFLALLVLWALGALVLSLGGIRAKSGGEAMVSGFVTGVGLLALVGSTVVISGVRLSTMVLYGVILLLSVVAWRRRRFAMLCPRLPGDWVTLVILAAAALLAIALTAAATRDQLWWDGWAIWAFKARVLVTDGTLPSQFLDPEGPYGFTHLSYPLAVPLTLWWLSQHAGDFAPAIASFQGAIWIVLIGVLLCTPHRTHNPHPHPALAGMGVLLFWPLVFYALGGTADVVIALALLGTVIGVVDGMGGDDVAFWRAGSFLLLGILTKNEGLAIAVVTLLVGGFALWTTRNSGKGSEASLEGHSGLPRFARGARYRALPLLVPLIALMPWSLFVRLRGVRERMLDFGMTGGELVERGWLLAVVFSDFLLSRPWLPLPFLTAIGLAALLRTYRHEPRVARALMTGWLVVGCYLTALLVVYIWTPQDIGWLLTTTLPRVLGPFVPAVIYLTLRSVGESEASQKAP